MPAAQFPLPLTAYPPIDGAGILNTLIVRVQTDPFNAVATGIFLLAILHTFSASWFAGLAHRVQHRHDAEARAAGRPSTPSIAAELLHFLGEVEVVFGLWAAVLLIAITVYEGWDAAKHYLNDSVNYTEPLFVVVIMALASTRPVITFAEGALRRLANAGGGTPAAWWVSILTVGPLLGSFVTEPAAITICALLLARQFYDLQPGRALKYATLGLLFVNISIGGTLTHFAAPPVLMVARTWEWDTRFMLLHFGWRAVLAILISTGVYFVLFRRELRALAARPGVADIDQADEEAKGPALLPVPAWLVAIHIAFMGWTVFTAHYPALFLGGFLFFLGFARATAAYQSRIELRTPLLVGFFLAGLVIHGGLQGWWISPVLGSLTRVPLFVGATVLTAFNDNALITYLSTLVPHLDSSLQLAVVRGAVVGGGLTVIANAPNPAGQALLGRFFDHAVSPGWLLAAAALPTLVAAAAFMLI
ncbi:MAG TPA: putative Na+/H+ antiporter [Gemmatimonadales bacterium]|nr:putative Na+/H+ antiporter [Gemmatimonadales bacterium]